MILTVYVKTRAGKEQVEWLDADTLKVATKEAPEKGKANRAIIKLLSKELDCPQSLIQIIRGKTTQIKQVEIKNA